MDEFGLIEKYFKPLSRNHKGAFGLTDDAAIFNAPSGYEVVVAKDAIAENVHFLANTKPQFIAKKLLRTNLSDMAAMGATPKFYLISAAFPEYVDEKWIADFAGGLKEDQKIFNITLIGGDTIKSSAGLVLSLTIIGWVKKGKAVLRSDAKPGDDIYVSGTIGDSALGLKTCKGEISVSKKHDNFLVLRYHVPEPRLALAKKLSGLINSSIDISDGLISDLKHIAQYSKVSAEIDFERIPLSPAAASLKNISGFNEIILNGGDDYELLFTAPKKNRGKIDKYAKLTGNAVSIIGSVIKGKPGNVRTLQGGKEISAFKSGFKHF